jgi:hypothetical protein
MDQSLSGALPFRGFQAGEILRPVAALMNQKAEEALSEPSDRWSVALTETPRRVLAAILYLLKAGCQWARPACSLVGAPTAGSRSPVSRPIFMEYRRAGALSALSRMKAPVRNQPIKWPDCAYLTNWTGAGLLLMKSD